MRTPGPMRPEDVRKAKVAALPQEVFDAFNELIAKAWDGASAIVRQDEVLAGICRRLGITPEQAYSDMLLDVEEAYRGVGWAVFYDKPSYCETYTPTFEFKEATKR